LLYPNWNAVLSHPSDNINQYLYFKTNSASIDKIEPYYGRIILQEFLQTFTFVLVYLVLNFEKDLKMINKVLKGFILGSTLYACTYMTYWEGASLNPAFGAA
jgi:glycerol uptake facilitator-like aquaporin